LTFKHAVRHGFKIRRDKFFGFQPGKNVIPQGQRGGFVCCLQDLGPRFPLYHNRVRFIIRRRICRRHFLPSAGAKAKKHGSCQKYSQKTLYCFCRTWFLIKIVLHFCFLPIKIAMLA
jgi:hypothetical protein